MASKKCEDLKKMARMAVRPVDQFRAVLKYKNAGCGSINLKGLAGPNDPANPRIIDELEGYIDRYLEAVKKWPIAAREHPDAVQLWSGAKQRLVEPFRRYVARGTFFEQSSDMAATAIMNVNSDFYALEKTAEKTGENKGDVPWLLFGALAVGALGLWWAMRSATSVPPFSGMRRRRLSR